MLKRLSQLLVILAILLAAVLIFFRWQASARERQTRQEAAPSSGHFVQAGDLEIFVQAMGPTTGQAVLFIHGTAAWGEIWRETMTALAEAGYRAIALDMPPFGFSERPDTPRYSRSDQATRIIGVLEALNLSGVTLVGHSFGGGGTVEAAMVAPERFQSLVLVDVALSLQTQATESSLLLDAFFVARPLRNAVIATTITNPQLTKRLLQQLILDPADATEAQVAMLQRQSVLQDSTNAMGDWLYDFLTTPEVGLSTDLTNYQHLTMPTLILWGDSDTITPLSQGEHLHSLIPASTFVILKQVGHIPHLEDNARFNEALLTFLKAHL